jgi:hypothetical protein
MQTGRPSGLHPEGQFVVSGRKPEGHLTVIFLSWKQGQKKALDGKRRHEMALTQGDGFEGKSEKSEQEWGLVKNGFIRLITRRSQA